MGEERGSGLSLLEGNAWNITIYDWSQISEEIPSLLVIMSHREWDSGEDGMEKKGGGSQTSVTGNLQKLGSLTTLN